ncbi:MULTISPECIES: hypothetical protein [Luteimonas]|uniref:hypothetical protein n=1 Tax=Luteimonas TaxID=83614 RepID=UPI00118136CC|nr:MULTISPECIES: hypothetical protein [Luteimonas]
MKRLHKGRLYGFYFAIALIVYALLGDVLNDLFIPGRRGRGLHLHYEAIPPAVLAIVLLASKLLVDTFSPIPYERWVQRGLTVAAVLAFGWSLYLVGNPTGRRAASLEGCHATFARLASVVDDASWQDMMRERSAACVREPVLDTYHRCVVAAEQPQDINRCGPYAQHLFERENSTPSR